MSLNVLEISMFAVFWRNLPASTLGFPFIIKNDGWDEHEFDSFDKALQYARDWMYNDNLELEPDQPLDYSGDGHFIEIRTINKENTNEQSREESVQV
jgi:hypothetical protein